MLKLFIGLLLLVNLGLYGYSAGYLGTGSIEGREPARAAGQLNADRIRRIEPSAPPATPAASVASATSATSATSTTSATSAALVVPALPAAGVATENALPAALTPTPLASVAAVSAQTASCTEVGNFDAAEARRFEARLAPLGLGNRLGRRNVQESERHMVYIAPLPDKESADRKAAELRRLGVDDFYVIQDNSDLRWGISLGMFKTADAAYTHLANLGLKGVRSARVAARPGAGSKTAFQMRGLDAAGQATLAQIRLGFARQDARACPPA